MAGNAVTLTFAGDAGKLQKAAAQAVKSTESVGDAARAASQSSDAARQSTDAYADRMGRLGATAAGMSAAVDDAGGTVSALAALQNRGADRAQAQARALADVEQAGLDAEQALGDLRQAQVDLNQAQLDAKQAGADAEQAIIDQKQAALDAKTAQAEYNAAVKEHGKNSVEARQAAIDLSQAQQDLKQAGIDAEQSQIDLKQATEDQSQAQRDAAQAGRDAKDAQLNLNDAQRAADPSTLTRWGSEIEAVSTAALGLVGTVNLLAMANNAVSLSSIRAAAATTASKAAQLAGAAATGIATAAQWAWNVAMSANPIGLVVLAVGALIAAIVWVATKTTWFQTIWKYTWTAIKAAAQFVVDWIVGGWTWAFKVITAGVKAWWSLFTGFWGGVGRLAGQFLDYLLGIPGRVKKTFASVASAVSAPFRSAFNAVSRAWNSTVGRLSWSVPGWVPGLGGSSISAPRLPTFHTGGTVPGRPGEQVPIMALAGEEVVPRGQAGGAAVLVIDSAGSRLDDLLLEVLRRAVKDGGGNVQVVLGGRRAA
ncbi:hypothetical protein [Micromonospora sp. C41]|uniref:hypothetical protein n=1 Tax=Micromonospora sp. C41 TaxID=2824878 RepID=UPI001B36FDDF|nr:hypothetical protein [Micromonospora sp. C41]MBQ1061331.1 hypothetical protein [Micromonospora sp. C41]